MRTKIILLFVFFITNKLFSQYGIIEDKDGFVNVRDKKSTNGKIVDTFHNGKILYFIEQLFVNVFIYIY